MANSRRIATLVLSLGFMGLVSMACETQTERQTVTETAPSPTVSLTPSPTGAVTPTVSPVALTTAEKDFLTYAATGGMVEVQLGNFAEQKAASEDVKKYGEHLATDHSQLGQKLQQLASNLGVRLTQEMTPEQQNLVSRLEKLSGKAFDREFIKAMIADHVKDVAEFERMANQATNADIKQFATEALPMLRDHLKMARELASKGGGEHH
jgi:putative membrane protein